LNGADASRFAVTGTVTIAGTRLGVPDLVVEAEHVSATGESARLASAATDAQGAFAINLPRPAGTLAALFRDSSWNLRLVVRAPETSGTHPAQRLLYRSEVRTRVVGAESFRISIDPESLKRLDVPSPVVPATPAATAASAVAAMRENAEVIQRANDAILIERLDAVTRRRETFRDSALVKLREELSTVSEAERASDRFVATEDQIDGVGRAALVADIAKLAETTNDPDTGATVGTVRLRSRLLVAPNVADTLLGNGNQPVTVTEDELEGTLGYGLDKPAAVYRRQLEPDPCRPQNDADCCLDDAQAGEGGAEGGDHTETDGNGSGADGDAASTIAGAHVTFDKKTLIADLFARQTAPEAPVEFGTGTRLEGPLTAGGVSDVISGVTLAPGPADVPAFYDFHDLQVAFEPVWQEALDDRYLKDVASAYDQIVERGGEPAVTRIGGLLATPGRFLDGFLDALDDIGVAADAEVPPAVIAAVYISLEEWRALGSTARAQLSTLASRIQDLRERVLQALDPDSVPDISAFNLGEMIRAANTKESIALRAQIELLTADAERMVAHARRLLLDREAKEAFRPTHEVIDGLRASRGTAYPFRFFAATATDRSVNFGIVVTYRQSWTPVSYQVGELVSTIPLAPREIRRFSKKTVVRTKRARQEVESNLISRRMESEEQSRAEAEIVARATAKTNFTLTNTGTVKMSEDGVGTDATTTSSFTRDAEQHSEATKKEFREAVLKSAEEYKSERKIEVSTEESFESETTESGEIQNPNDEIPVTFLFYELQRRFRVAEKLHRLQSVVLVAQEVPAPSAIDAAWLVRYDWILNRVLLDDSFRSALGFASSSMISDEVVLREMRQALFRQRQLVEELKEDVADRRADAGLRYAALERQIERTASSADSGGGGLFGGLGKLVGGVPLVGDLVQGGLDLLGGSSGPSEAAQIREGAARDAFDREQREEEELASRLQNASSTLESMQRDFTARLGAFLTQLAQVERLATHVAQNISYYMQAIWAYEPDDQRYLRLRNVPVPVFEKDKNARHYVIDSAAVHSIDPPVMAMRRLDVRTDFGVLNPPAQPQQIKTQPLSEVADIGRPLGFLGNYMIFPMVEANPITDFMMDPYVTVAAGEYGVTDPDPLGNITLDEFCQYVCCLKRHLEETASNGNGNGETGGPSFEDLKPQLREALKELLQRSLRNNEEVIVPSNSLFIEALPGAHSVMETFKLLHRQIDVKIAQSRLRELEIDNIRQAQRILEDELEDPDIEAKYVFEGGGTATVVPPAPPPPPGGGPTPSG
jgi:hypothetical protein